MDPLERRRRELWVAWAALLLAVAGWLTVLLPDAPVARPVWRCDAACRARPEGLLFGEVLDLNRASAEQLEVLPGVGPARAEAIVRARETTPFERVDDLRAVRGIGPRTLAGLEGWVGVGETRFDEKRRAR